MADDSFRLPVSSYEELTKIIKAYASVQQLVSLDEISHRTGLHRTVISKNHAFLSSIGVIEGTTKKGPTDNGKKLGQALHHSDTQADVVATAWQRVVQDSDFLSKMLTAVKIRKGMDRASLEGHIAYSAGQPKSPVVMTGARTIIDILKAAQVVLEDNDKLMAVSFTPREELGDGTPLSHGDRGKQAAFTPSPVAVYEGGSGEGVLVRIDIRINADPADLDDLGVKIRKMLKDIRGTRTHDDENDTNDVKDVNGATREG